MTTRQTLGQRLAQARREKAVRDHRDITQADVADAVGYSRTAVSEWEADAKVPREGALSKLAAYLGVTPAFLRYGIDPETRGATAPLARGTLSDELVERVRRKPAEDRDAPRGDDAAGRPHPARRRGTK